MDLSLPTEIMNTPPHYAEGGRVSAPGGDDPGMPAGDDSVNVINPSGNLVSIPKGQVSQAVSQFGYRIPSAEEVTKSQNYDKYGGNSGELKTALLGAAKGVSFGAIPYALSESGLVPPETQRGLEETNPNAFLAGETAGVVGSLLTPLPEVLAPVKAVSALGRGVTKAVLPGAERAAGMIANPVTSPIAHQAVSQAMAHATGSAIEGAFFGLGEAVNEAALGDPHALSEKLMAHVGYGSLFGGGLGALVGGGIGSYKGLKDYVVSKEANALAQKEAIRQGSLQEGMKPASELATPALDSELTELTQKAPTSLEEIGKRVKEANLPHLPQELPSKDVLAQATARVGDMNFPIHEIQMKSLDSKAVRDAYKTFLETGEEEAKQMSAYEGAQKAELVSKAKKTVDEISPQVTLSHDPVEGGERVIKAFKEQYDAEKKELAPYFKKFDDVGANPLKNFATEVEPLENAIPGVGKYMKVGTEGKLTIAPYRSSMPFTKTTHTALSDLITQANDTELTLGGLRNIRENMRTMVNPLSAPAERSEINRLRSMLMDYIQDSVQELEPDLKVRDLFKRYAVNESERHQIEKMLGGNIADKDFGTGIGTGKPIPREDVLRHLFGDTETVKASKAILGQKTFDEALGNFMKTEMSARTDLAKNGFSSNGFSTFLKKKAPEFQIAFAEKPQALTRLHDLTDIMRILPDSPSVNPSGTAKAVDLRLMSKLGKILKPREALSDFMAQKAEAEEKARQRSIINSYLKGDTVHQAQKTAEEAAVHATMLGQLERAAKEFGSKIVKKVGSLFDDLAPFVGAKLSPKEKLEKQEKTEKKRKETSSLLDSVAHPEAMLDRLEKMTHVTYAAAPEVSGAIQQTAIRATQFLQTKLPRQTSQSVFAPKYAPSDTEKVTFSNYVRTIENPMHILDDVKAHRVSTESMETLSAVYPNLLQEMRGQVIERLSEKIGKGERIPGHLQVSLSLFMGQPMTDALRGDHFMANQGAIHRIEANQGNSERNQGRNSPAASKMKLGQRAMTAVGRAEARGTEKA